MRKITFTIYLSMLVSALLGATNKQACDSLKRLIVRDSPDTNRVNHLNELAYLYRNSFPDSTLYFSSLSIQLCKKIFSDEACQRWRGYGNAIGNIGIAYRLKGDYTQAEKYYFKALEIDRRTSYQFGIGKRLVGISNLYTNTGNYAKALEFGYLALEQNTKIKNQRAIALSNSVIGKVYEEMGEYAKSLSFANKSEITFLKIKDYNNITAVYYQTANLHYKNSDYSQAVKYLIKAIKIANTHQLIQEKADILNIMAKVCIAQNKLDTAKIILRSNEELCRKYHLEASLGECYLHQGNVLLKSKKYREAYSLLSQANFYFIRSKARNNRLQAEEQLSIALQGMGEYQKALTHLQVSIFMRDSIFNLQNSQKISAMQFERKAAETKLLNDKKTILSNQKIKSREMQRNASLIGFALMILFAANTYKNYKRKQQANLRISKQNKQIVEQNELLNILQAMGNQINSTLDLPLVMQYTYSHIQQIMDTSFFIINSFDEQNQTTRVIYCVKKGIVVTENFQTSITNTESFSAYTLKNKSEVIVEDLQRDHSKYLKGVPKTHGPEDVFCESLVFIPLIIRDQVIGLFSVQSERKHAYSQMHYQLLRSMANIIAIALNNSISYGEINKAKNEISGQKELVEQKNREILDSIEYAKRIQNTILPPHKIVTQHLENSFILYLPKDIVAGDFYWFAPPQPSPKRMDQGIPNSNENSPPLGELEGDSILFAACDCTGHGVPGAMVSVVCSNALNKAVKEFQLHEPAKILDKVAELVVDDLSKNNEEGDELQDGMDASLCKLNLKTLELEWAGANNPLWLIRNPSNHTSELLAITADKQPIGKTDNLRPFINHKLQLQKGDTLYLFTDGYADQFGGEKGKKLSKNKFKDLLLSIQHLTMNEQREALFKAHKEWKGENEQVDDICVIGVRV